MPNPNALPRTDASPMRLYSLREWHGAPRVRLLLAAIVLLALFARVIYVGVIAQFDSPPTFDGISYDLLATHLLAGKGYTLERGMPTAFRPPGYPLFLTGIYAIFGHRVEIARAIQIALDVLTCVLLYALGAQLFNPRVGLLTALFGALYPLLIYMTGELYGETVAIFVILCAIWLVLLDFKVPTRWRSIVAGLLLGFAILIRPNFLLWVPLGLVWVWLNQPPRRALVLSATLLILPAFVIAPWALRNYLRFGAFIPLTTQSGVNLWQGNNPLADGAGVWPLPENWNGDDPPTREIMGWRGLSEVENSARFASVALTWIQTHPAEAALLVPRKLVQVWSPMAFAIRSDRPPPPIPLSAVLVPYLLFLATALVGLIVSRHKWRLLFGLYAWIIVVNVSAAIFFGGTRYGLPMAPTLLLLSAAGVDWLWRRARQASNISCFTSRDVLC